MFSRNVYDNGDPVSNCFFAIYSEYLNRRACPNIVNQDKPALKEQSDQGLYRLLSVTIVHLYTVLYR